MASNNSTYYKRKNEHRCVYCGVVLPVEYDRLACKNCISYHAEQTRVLRRDRKERGLCLKCGCVLRGQELMEANTCRSCRDKVHEKYVRNREYISDYNRKRRDERKKLGVCQVCNEPAVPGLTRCEKHREYANEIERKRRRFNPV